MLQCAGGIDGGGAARGPARGRGALSSKQPQERIGEVLALADHKTGAHMSDLFNEAVVGLAPGGDHQIRRHGLGGGHQRLFRSREPERTDIIFSGVRICL